MTNKDKLVQVFCRPENPFPLKHYERVWKWYHEEHTVSDHMWSEYTSRCLDELMEENKDVLFRLKTS